ncbi:hypothetical protein ACFWVB_26195 [Streptomyces microflavus]|uniref:hypothetical protein n=1 Tax=Streptomyces microflavus TaxID=1919 RepID=UPI003656023D
MADADGPGRHLDLLFITKGCGRWSKTKTSRRRGKRKSAEGLSSLTKSELYERASKADIAGRSKMTREQLLKALDKTKAAA